MRVPRKRYLDFFSCNPLLRSVRKAPLWMRYGIIWSLFWRIFLICLGQILKYDAIFLMLLSGFHLIFSLTALTTPGVVTVTGRPLLIISYKVLNILNRTSAQLATDFTK
ncbi:unnamed protein product [Caenorhabditis nigoni]